MKESIFTYILPAAIILIGIYLSFWTEMLKDSGDILNPKKRTYSFARAQLMWWSLIIISTFCAFYGLKNSILEISESSLILMGISLGTTTASKIIDNTDINNNNVRHQDVENSKNFLTDILSDENGISVHRFQALVFNIIFGLIFINEFITTEEFIEFGKLDLTLMGISSAAYVGIKINENSSSKSHGANNQAQDLNDDDNLTDIDESYTNQINEDS